MLFNVKWAVYPICHYENKVTNNISKRVNGVGLQVDVLNAAGNIGVGLQVDVLIAAGKTECSIGSKYLPRQGLPTTTSNAIGKNDHKKKGNIPKRRALSDMSTM